MDPKETLQAIRERLSSPRALDERFLRAEILALVEVVEQLLPQPRAKKTA